MRITICSSEGKRAGQMRMTYPQLQTGSGQGAGRGHPARPRGTGGAGFILKTLVLGGRRKIEHQVKNITETGDDPGERR